MADAASFRTYLRDVIGIPDPRERREAVQEQGLGVLTDFLEFDKEAIEVLCSSVRKPGGTIPNPDIGNLGAPAAIPNPGYSIPAICEKRLIAASYTAKLYDMIGRAITSDTMSRERIKKFETHRILMEDHEDPEKLQVVSKSFGIIRAMDMVPSHLRDRLGVRKIPLSYVIRETADTGNAPLPAADEPTSGNYNSITEELIHYAPHSGDEYAEDNAKVFQILQDMVAGTSFESSVKSYQRRRDGRAAYFALCQHNLGSSKWDKILEDAETYVSKREWNGKNYRYSLKLHINKHREAYNDMVRASQHVQYALPNEHTRVGRLLKSITSKDASIVSAITHVHGSTTQRNDFEMAADFLLLTSPSNTNVTSTQRISVSRVGGVIGDTKKGPETGVEVRYYTKKEYGRLSQAQKQELAKLRKSKGDGSKSNISNVKQDLMQEMRELENRLVAAIATARGAPKDLSNEAAIRNPLKNPLNQRGDS